MSRVVLNLSPSQSGLLRCRPVSNCFLFRVLGEFRYCPITAQDHRRCQHLVREIARCLSGLRLLGTIFSRSFGQLQVSVQFASRRIFVAEALVLFQEERDRRDFRLRLGAPLDLRAHGFRSIPLPSSPSPPPPSLAMWNDRFVRVWIEDVFPVSCALVERAMKDAEHLAL